MAKTILGVLSLLVIMSCSIPVKENTVQPNIMETNKKNLGNLLALYPKPMTVVGAEVEGKVNWLVVGHTGVIGHERILISMSKSHYTNQGIKDSKRLSVNLVSREILPKADYVGSVSGATVDKSEVFAYHIGENGTPVIDASPLTMECEVVDINRKTFCDTFSNRFVSVLQLLTQNEMRFFICFLTLFKHLSKGFQKFLKSSGIFIFV